MKRTILLTVLLVAGAAGCGDDKKAVEPKGPMTPPPAGAEGQGSTGGKKSPNNTAAER